MRLRNPAEATRQLGLIRDIAADMIRDATQLHGSLVDGLGGYPSGGVHVGGRGSDLADPTSRLGCADHADQAALDVARLEQAYGELWAVAVEIDDIRRRWKRRPGHGVCGNDHGCPVGKRAAPGRKGLCNGCYSYFAEHGVHRQTARIQTA